MPAAPLRQGSPFLCVPLCKSAGAAPGVARSSDSPTCGPALSRVGRKGSPLPLQPPLSTWPLLTSAWDILPEKASWPWGDLRRCGRLPVGWFSHLCVWPLSSRPGPEPVTKLQRAPAATTCHEISPDCHFSTAGPEQRQVRLCSGSLPLASGPVISTASVDSESTGPWSPGLVLGTGWGWGRVRPAGGHTGCCGDSPSSGPVGPHPFQPLLVCSASHPATLQSNHPLTTLPHRPFGRKARGEAKKCRKVYGIEHRDQWCTACRWKKACQRFLD